MKNTDANPDAFTLEKLVALFAEIRPAIPNDVEWVFRRSDLIPGDAETVYVFDPAVADLLPPPGWSIDRKRDPLFVVARRWLTDEEQRAAVLVYLQKVGRI